MAMAWCDGRTVLGPANFPEIRQNEVFRHT